jgi:hypothetical protein
MESRVNPIKVMFDINIYLKLLKFLTNSLPEIELIPNKKDLIDLPKYKVVKKKVKKIDDDEEVNTLDFSFLFEVRKPSFLIPSNSIGSSIDVQELIMVSAKEFILTSDQRIKRPGWTESRSLYELKDDFPSKEDDYSQSTLWELLPRKLKIKLTEFIIKILPSITSPPQDVMKPLSLELDIGINDDSISTFHKNLPKIVVLTNIEEIEFKINQNQ